MVCCSAQVSQSSKRCLVYRLEGNEHPVVFSGDAAKNRAELLSMATDMTMDAGASHASLDRIWGLWRQVPGTLLISNRPR